jgi:hypothetical protein
MEILWLDGDIMESWDDLIEHLWMIGEIEQPNAFDVIYKGVRYTKDQLIEVLKPLVELNTQLCDAWALLFEFKDLAVPHSLEPFKEKVKAYLTDSTGWREKDVGGC